MVKRGMREEETMGMKRNKNDPMNKSPRGRSVTMKDIAEVAGVSPATVSLAINQKAGITEETRQRVLDMAKRLNYKKRPRRRSTGEITTSKPLS
jgi:alkylated DNA nucleotide flippase Atl1